MKIKYEKTCALCNNKFKTTLENKIVCNNDHYRTCKYCNKKFKIKASDRNVLTRDYCYNKDCSTKASREKAKQTMLEKYGVDNPAKSKEIYSKIKQTNLEKYGVDIPFKLKETRNKFKKTMIERYGAEYTMQSNELKNKAIKTKLKKYGNLRYSNLEKYLAKIKQTNLEKYNVPWYCMTEKCIKSQGNIISNINKDFSKRLKENNIENELEFRLKNYSYDLHILNTNILIEIDPTYTHNSTIESSFKNHQIKPKNKDYHFNKTNIAKENGYHCIHIFDWDDKEKIINMLKLKQNIEARKCNIQEVTKQRANEFLDKYHLQNSCRGNDINIALVYNNEIIELMTFGKPRYNKNYEYELLRLCSHKDYQIIGGSEKLFKYFIENYNPKSIISYCDNSKFDGSVYNRLNFNLDSYGNSSKHWYSVKTKKHITNNLLMQQGFDRLFNTNYGKGTSNEELMIKEGFVEIYDCGQSTYTWKNEINN